MSYAHSFSCILCEKLDNRNIRTKSSDSKMENVLKFGIKGLIYTFLIDFFVKTPIVFQ